MGRRFGSSDPSHTAWRIRQIAGPDLALRYLEGRCAAVDPQAPAPPPAPAPAPAMPDNPMRALFEQLRGEMSKAMPALSAHERTQVGGLFGRIEPLVTVNRTPPDFGGLLSTGSSLQRSIRQGEHLSRNAGLDAPAEAVSCRTDRVLAALTELKLALLRQGLHPHAGSAAFGAATELFTRLGQLSKSWQDAPGDADAFARVERDQARPLALEVFEFLRASHAHEVRPVFPGPVPPMDASTLFFSGAPGMLAVLQRAAQRIGLQVDPLAPPGADFALQRWRSLRRSALAVFDLGSAKPQVFYELGLALATGVQLLLLAPLDHVLPFDVAQTVTRYTTLQELEAQLPQALDEAGYRVQINAPRSVNGRDALWNQEILRVSAAIGGDVLCGRWMPQPVSATPRWFAVMPFRAGPDARWQLMARRLQRLKPGLAQVRGDRAQGQEIVASIWDELCRASHVSADLTELNPNVCLEVGIAHALGRPTLLIGQAATARRLDAELPGLAKWRCHEYGRGQSRSFNAVVDQFFGVV